MYVSPVFWDQPWFGDRVAEMGIGRRLPPPDLLSAEDLVAAIAAVRTPGSPLLEAAAAAAAAVAAESGVSCAANRIEDSVVSNGW